MSVIVGQQPTKHNYFNQEDFLKYDRKAGTILTHSAQRAIHVSEDFILGLQVGLEEEVGDASAVVMYRVGHAWGLEDMRAFETRLSREFGRDMHEMN
ncbi:MAG: 4-vinyl reductase, partial [Myxococcota bacterium]